MARIRAEFPRADDLTLLGAHSSHSYQTGTNLYFVYDYDDPLRARARRSSVYHKPLNAIIVEEALRVGRLDGAPPRRRQVPHAVDGRGARQRLLAAEALKQAFDPHGIMNAGTIFPLADSP